MLFLCGDDVGACEPGELRCVAGDIVCFGGVSPAPEACNCRDENCNGVVTCFANADNDRGAMQISGSYRF